MCKYAPFLQMYAVYVEKFDSAMKAIDAYKIKSPRFAALLQELGVSTNQGRLQVKCGQLTSCLFVFECRSCPRVASCRFSITCSFPSREFLATNCC